MDIVKFEKELFRRCDQLRKESCIACVFRQMAVNENKRCSQVILKNLSVAWAIVEKWSQDNPAKTRKQLLLETFPDFELTTGNKTPAVCVRTFGYKVDKCAGSSCKDCWNKEV